MAEDKQELTPTVEKKAKKKLSGKQKGIIAGVVVAVVILLVGIAGYVVTHVNSYAFYNKVVIALAPDKIEDYGKNFYLKTNPNYDQKKAPNEPMFICYYKAARKWICPAAPIKRTVITARCSSHFWAKPPRKWSPFKRP